jgi:outer membrane protein assembly factor BamB
LYKLDCNKEIRTLSVFSPDFRIVWNNYYHKNLWAFSSTSNRKITYDFLNGDEISTENVDRIYSVFGFEVESLGIDAGYTVKNTCREVFSECHPVVFNNIVVTISEHKRRQPKVINAYDSNLKELWSVSSNKAYFCKPSGDERFYRAYDFDDSIVFSDGDWIVKLDKRTGEEFWCFKPGNSRGFDAYHLVKHDLILFMGLSTVYLLNPDNGEVINQIDFSKTYNYLAAEYDGEYIYIFLNDSPQILVYDKTGSTLINRIDIPEPYQFMTSEVPHLVDGVLYASLNCATRTYNALMTLTKDELLGNTPLNIEYEARPETTVECVKNPDDSDHYVVTVTGDRADWVFRYAGVAAMDVVAKYGSAAVPSPELNQDFNGLIKIRIGGLAEEDRTDEFLERLAFQVARSAVDQFHGAGIHNIRAECEWV